MLVIGQVKLKFQGSWQDGDISKFLTFLENARPFMRKDDIQGHLEESLASEILDINDANIYIVNVELGSKIGAMFSEPGSIQFPFQQNPELSTKKIKTNDEDDSFIVQIMTWKSAAEFKIEAKRLKSLEELSAFATSRRLLPKADGEQDTFAEFVTLPQLIKEMIRHFSNYV